MEARQADAAAEGELLSIGGLVRHFRGVRAIDGVDLGIRRGQALGLIGPNGAGKSTLFRLITGLLEPEAGTIHYDGEEIGALAPEDRYRRGLAWSFQHSRCFPSLSVQDHLRVARSHHTEGSSGVRREVADRWLEEVGLLNRARSPVADLSLAERKLLDFARAACSGPSLLLLDEPFASLSRTQVARLTEAIRKARQRGATLLVIEHRLRELVELVEEIAVLAAGVIIDRGAPAEVLRAPLVLRAYFGVEA